MKHVEQGHDECQLATIAMLSGKPKHEIKKYIEFYIGGDYNNSFGSFRWKIGIKNAFKKYLNEQMFIEIFYMWGANRIGTDKITDTLNLDGKGQITIIWERGGAHAMAYNNGLVHDPNMSMGCNWNTWLNEICKIFYPSEVIKSFSIVPYVK